MDELCALLKRRQVELVPVSEKRQSIAYKRKNISVILSNNYKAFNVLRMHLFGGNKKPYFPLSDGEKEIVDMLLSRKYIKRNDKGIYKISSDNSIRNYIRGAWLEELVWIATKKAGVDAATFGQEINWTAGKYYGSNEIDVIARVDEKLIFISCKTRQPFPSKSKSYRSNFKHNLDETDNYKDQFGGKNDMAILFNTRDLYDERNNNEARYGDIMGKAYALDVKVMGLENLPYKKMVSSLKDVIKEL